MQLTLQDAFALATRHESAGRRADARAIYEQILAALPDHPGALLKMALQEIDEGHTDAARARLERALDSARQLALPPHEIWLALGRVHLARADRAKAAEAVERALELAPEGVEITTRLGHLALDSGHSRLGERCFRAALEREPRHAAAASGLALALTAQQRWDEARASARAAIENAPSSLQAIRVMAYVALERREPGEAQRFAREGLAHHPRDVYLLHVLGNALKASGAAHTARKVLAECAALAPDDAGVRISLGAACLDDANPAEARTHLERAIALGAQGGEVWDNLGLAYRRLGDAEQALRAFETAVARDPALTPALANVVYVRQRLCEWDGLPAYEDKLAATLDDPAADPRWPPLIALSMPSSPAQQLDVARRWSRAMLPEAAASQPAPPRRGRLRVGYLSGNFHEHPTARLMVGLFEEHDRSNFEITGYSYGPDDGSALRARVRDAFEHWHDVRSLADADVAELIRDDGIELLIDRNGHTLGGRLAILAQRPAPVQVHYMSFPGTLGYDALDGVIADATVIPPGDEAHFHERVWRLPRCYFVNDRRRGLPRAAARAAHGLPEEALVLACLNHSYKIRRAEFAIWMEALRAQSAAVLWLLAGPSRSQANLRAEAGRADVDPDRLIFAPLLPQDEHIARLRCADLALDTLPYGAHTTGVDALWAGVPMLTCRGSTFAGRVGASLLLESGLPDLIADSLEAYEARLLELVATPTVLRGYRDYLERTRDRNSLFDTKAFARDWEALLVRIYDESVRITA
jgi:predicted O-linked N-acetylglucosamine transferase (SPINDLY family)